MSKFLNDICRTVGCDDRMICDRCGNPPEKFFKKVVTVVLGEEVCMDDTLDDLDQVELVMALEEEYDTEILDAAVEGLTTPEEYYNYLFQTLGRANV